MTVATYSGMTYTDDIYYDIYQEMHAMNKAKIFVNGRSQAVRLPKEYRFDTDEVYINKIGNIVLLAPADSLISSFELGASLLTDDFLEGGIPGSVDSERINL